MNGWEQVKLGDLYSVHNGISKGKQFFGKGYPFLSFSTVFNNWFLPLKLDSLVESTEQEQNSYSIRRGDVFITRTSETMDELGMSSVALNDIPNATYNGFTKRLRPITNKVLPEFIGYYMRSPKFRGKFMAFSSMTTRASLSNAELLGMQIELPCLEMQYNIATILRSYDNLIDNYRRQIKLLEEAAQRLYKEWFVDLRFPGHEHTKIVDGVPEGWKKKRLRDVANVNQENIAADYSYSYVHYVDLGSVNAGRILAKVTYNKGEEPGRAKRRAKDGDTIWGMVRPNLKSYALIQHPDDADVFSTGFAVISPIDIGFAFLHCYLTTDSYIGYLVNCTNGAAYPAVKPCHFEDSEIIVPTDKTLKIFEPMAQRYFRNVYQLERQIILLTEARDRLLPKLMSGEIKV